jgi:glycine/D-amino acid oxidase-like deaminating enzyme
MRTMPPSDVGPALAGARHVPFWLDRERPAPEPALAGRARADLAVVGAGFTGLWAALQAKEEDPGREVVVLEGATAGEGASGRNGGFWDASLTHGLANGLARFPEEIEALEALGAANVAGIEDALARHGIDADWRRTGMITVARTPAQLREGRAWAAELVGRGTGARWLERHELAARVRSPQFLGGVLESGGVGLVDPGRLVDGLRRAALGAGVRLHERTRVAALRRTATGVELRTDGGAVLDARRVLLATNAYRPLVRSIRRIVVPVYDYVLVTEPLSGAQRAAIGWDGGEGLADAGNRFHYFRMTADGRILWGGYDAVYHFANGMKPALERRERSFTGLARRFRATFPELADVRFTHAWGGAIDTCSRFAVTWGRALDGRVVYAVGYTGLGVAASRFGARVALDLLDGRGTERTSLRFVRERPLPFPPEPLRWAVVRGTERAMERADRRGRRGAWLGALDRLGLGFDS